MMVGISGPGLALILQNDSVTGDRPVGSLKSYLYLLVVFQILGLWIMLVNRNE
jgi:hypothetical protein